MSPWTYLAGAGLFGSLLGLLASQPLPWFAWVGVAVGCLAPHLLKKERHRRISHSLLAALGATLFLWSIHWEQCLWPAWFGAGWGAGYLGHLLLDCLTVQGVTLFWPSSVIAVLPKAERFRIEPGAPAERRLQVVLLLMGLLLVPLQALGLRGALHRLVQTPQSAEEDYLRCMHENRQVWVDFEGFFTSSQRPVKGKWEAIHAPTANTLLLLDPEGRVHRIGNHPTDTIRPSRVRALRGKPMEVQVREVALKHQPLGMLYHDWPAGAQGFVTGWILLEEPVALRYGQEEFPTVTLSGEKLEFNQAPISEIRRQGLQAVPVLRGYLLIRLVRDKQPTRSATAIGNDFYGNGASAHP